MTSPALPPARVPARPYQPPAPLDPGVIRLDRNEGAWPDPAIFDALREAGPGLLRAYATGFPLEAALAERYGLSTDQVLVTNGADGVLDRVCRAWLAPGSEFLVATPTFELFPVLVELAGGRLTGVPWTDRYPIDAMVAAISERTTVIALVSPNNPTGQVASARDLRRLAEAAPGAMVILDQVYVDYADEDLLPIALAYPNVVTVQTFSKARGLAGCRVGYGIGSTAVIAALRAAGDPYAVAAPSVFCALTELTTGAERFAAHVAEIRRERTRLEAQLTEAGVPCPHSSGNFVFPTFGPRAAAVQAALRADGFLVRHFADHPELAEALRISLPGDPVLFDRFSAALARTLEAIR